jgi:hypothetical protein
MNRAARRLYRHMRYSILGGLLFLFFASLPVFGQGGFTTVSGAIVDPNGIPWTSGTISAQLITQGGTAPTLNGQPFTSTTASGLLGPGGTFTMRLGDNGVILPSGTTWQFTINIAPGVLPPEGKGPQSFVVTTPINCSTNTPTTCTSNAMTITTALTPVPALTFITSAVTAPTIFNPSTYGAKGGVRYTTSANFSNASQHVTCSAGDCGFLTTAKAGQIVLCTSFSAYVNGGAFTQTLLCPYGTTITAVNSNTDVTISATPSLSCTPTFSGACGFAWGTQDDSATLNAAALAAWGTPGICGQLQITDNYFFSQPIFDLTIAQLSSACGGQFGGANVSGIDSTQAGPALIGSGPQSGVLIPYNFNFAACVAIGCLFTTPNLFIDKMAINGLGQPATGVTPGQIVVATQGSSGGGSCTGSAMTNSAFSNWGVNQNMIGVSIGGAACGMPSFSYNLVEMFGATSCRFTGSSNDLPSYFSHNMCFGNTSVSLTINTGGIMNLDSNFIGGLIGSGATVLIANGGAGQIVNSRSNGYFGEFQSSGATVQFNTGLGGLRWNSDGDDYFLVSSTSSPSSAIVFASSAAVTFSMKNTKILASGTNNRAINQGGGGNTFINAGYNSITNGTLANVFGGTTIAQPSETQSGTCAANAATVTFNLTYTNAPLVTVSDTTSASTGAQATSTTTTTATIHCNGATDTFVATVTPNPI